jgi:hypothetical protein
MRSLLTRPLTLLLTFLCGLAIVLLWGLFVNKTVQRLARRAEQRVSAPYIAEAERRYMNRRILFDKRNYWEAPGNARPGSNGLDDLEAIGKEGREVKKRILPKLFQGSYGETVADCSRETRERPAQSEADLDRAREQGQYFPWVLAWHEGRFTEPGAFQMLYEINLNECNSRDAPVPPSRMLAVFDRWDRVYATFKPLERESVYEVCDVDGDAVDEVLMARGELRDNAYVVKLRLVSLKDGSFRVIHDFGLSAIFTFDGERVITLPVIYYTPRGQGETPEFHVDYYRAVCRKSEGCNFMPLPTAWQYLKSGTLSELD